MAIGRYIRRHREKGRMSQQTLADLMGVAQSTISNWESEFRHPDCEELKRLAQTLGVPMDELLRDHRPPTETRPCTDYQHGPSVVNHQWMEELIATQKEYIELLKTRIKELDLENSCLRGVGVYRER
jgi:transcriptional regulator with XRE-family HTH domain